MIKGILSLNRLLAAGACFIFFAATSMLATQEVKKNIAGPFESVFEVKEGRHTARLTIRTRPFRREAHRIERKDGGFLVDGREALGTDGGLPAIEIERVNLIFDGTAVSMPKKLYNDVYEPHMKEGSLGIRFGDDLSSLFVFIAGSDGAGSYQLLWVFRRDGNHSRFSRPCPDSRFIDFRGGVLDAVTENE